jgi:nucleoporin NUP159
MVCCYNSILCVIQILSDFIWPFPALIFSLLDELLSALKAAKEDEETFQAKRTVSPPGTPSFIAFACNDTRLFVGLEQGQLLVYDTAALFSPGFENVTPLNAVDARSGSIVQILPNPGTEANLIEMVAVVRGDGSVELLNMKLESQGGWVGSDAESAPVAGA